MCRGCSLMVALAVRLLVCIPSSAPLLGLVSRVGVSCKVTSLCPRQCPSVVGFKAPPVTLLLCLSIRRNQNFQDILRLLSLGDWQPSPFDVSLRFTHLFWCGDLNYRLDLDVQVRGRHIWDRPRTSSKTDAWSTKQKLFLNLYLSINVNLMLVWEELSPSVHLWLVYQPWLWALTQLNWYFLQEFFSCISKVHVILFVKLGLWTVNVVTLRINVSVAIQTKISQPQVHGPVLCQRNEVWFISGRKSDHHSGDLLGWWNLQGG